MIVRDTLLMLASYHGHRETTEVLLSRGADPNVPNDRGQTPLAGAVFKGDIDIIEALLKHGADPGGQPVGHRHGGHVRPGRSARPARLTVPVTLASFALALVFATAVNAFASAGPAACWICTIEAAGGPTIVAEHAAPFQLNSAGKAFSLP